MATLPLRKQYEGYDHDDPILRTGEGGLTIWVLQKMAQEKRFKELDDLFDNGVNMNSLPVGYSARAGVATLEPKLINEKLVNEWMSARMERAN